LPCIEKDVREKGEYGSSEINSGEARKIEIWGTGDSIWASEDNEGGDNGFKKKGRRPAPV
jgi:hypothetical protein